MKCWAVLLFKAINSVFSIWDHRLFLNGYCMKRDLQQKGKPFTSAKDFHGSTGTH